MRRCARRVRASSWQKMTTPSGLEAGVHRMTEPQPGGLVTKILCAIPAVHAGHCVGAAFCVRPRRSTTIVTRAKGALMKPGAPVQNASASMAYSPQTAALASTQT